ncbi:hypothetical protein A3781_10540 [Bacillus badius]|nr:hypothetical protein A3781_10540 [Bacillus badius]
MPKNDRFSCPKWLKYKVKKLKHFVTSKGNILLFIDKILSKKARLLLNADVLFINIEKRKAKCLK